MQNLNAEFYADFKYIYFCMVYFCISGDTLNFVDMTSRPYRILNRINEIRDYFMVEIREREAMRKWHGIRKN